MGRKISEADYGKHIDAMNDWKCIYRGDDEPTRFNLTLTKGINLTKELRYVCSMGKSDHVIIERETINDVSEEVESHKENKRNYGKMNIDELKKLYEEMNWEKLKRANDVQDKYDIFFLWNYKRQ